MTYTVLQRNGKYKAIVREKGPDDKWHQHIISLESTGKRAAKIEAAEKVKAYLDEKEESSKQKLSLGSLIRDYIESTTITPMTRYNYLNIVNSHINPYFGDRNFDKLTANDFSLYYKDLVETKNLSAKSVSKHHGLIHAAYEYAIDGNLITKNPSDRAKKPRVIKKEPSAYGLEDYSKLFAAAKESKIFPAIVLAMVYGLRRSEILGLRWSCIDWEKGKIEVSMSVTKVKGEWFFNDAMKTYGSKRTLHMSDPIADFLKNIKFEQEKMRELLGDTYNHEFDDFICVDSFGKLIDPNYITHEFAKLVKKNKLPKLTFHGLRHSFISILMDAGYDIKAIQTAAG
ncbi:MAG: site-specific integrase, partial [Flexilinea sp.]|nr:site-specific integrase [Flexilinea sp.]